MDISRIKYLQEANEQEALDTEEIIEIQAEFDLIPQESLRDLRENALVGDMLEELEARVSPTERAIYEYVEANYGEGNDPSWAIGPLATYLDKVMK